MRLVEVHSKFVLTYYRKKDNDKTSIVFKELPYQVNKSKLIENIAQLVRDKKISGISNLRDESDREGMRLVIELKRGEQHQVVLSSLYKQLMRKFHILSIWYVLSKGTKDFRHTRDS